MPLRRSTRKYCPLFKSTPLLTATIYSYFKYPYYDLPTASYCEEYKQAFAIGEFLTIADGDFDASGFTGAALVGALFLDTRP
jgi:hypothetical protein